MKNILVLTDFSPGAKHAAAYAYHLAAWIKADIILCNAIKIPEEMPLASFVSWPMQHAGVLIRESDSKLRKLRTHLDKLGSKLAYKPVIALTNQAGSLKDVIENILFDQSISLVVMVSPSAGFGNFILGSKGRYLIDDFKSPILLVPLSAKITSIKRIVFATDFYATQGDKQCISQLVPLAISLGAEIFISHIVSPNRDSDGKDEMARSFMFEICSKFKYPRISYRSMESFGIKDGLKILMSDGRMDLLVMVHRKKSFLGDLLMGSLARRMAMSIEFLYWSSKKTRDRKLLVSFTIWKLTFPKISANVRTNYP